jgi:hypothetical protein
MVKSLALLFAALLALPAAASQEDPKAEKEKAKQEAREREDAARKALEAYRAACAKAKNPEDIIMAIQDKLESAEPHPLIRSELINVLGNHRSIDVRMEAAAGLGKYKKDAEAGRVLLANSKAQRDEQLQKKCIEKFGVVALHRMAPDLKSWFSSDNTSLAREAIEAVEEINSVRMLRPLIELLGELESIREDKDGSGSGGSYGPPPPGVPQGNSSADQKLKRKRDLIDSVRKAINTLWKKYDPKLKTNTYKEANANLQRYDTFLKKIQVEEDKEDQGMKPEDKKDGEKKP